HDVEGATEVGRYPVPASAVVASAVEQEERRLLRIAPVDVVELQSLRVEVARDRAEDMHVVGHSLRRLPRTSGFAESLAGMAGSAPWPARWKGCACSSLASGSRSRRQPRCSRTG